MAAPTASPLRRAATRPGTAGRTIPLPAPSPDKMTRRGAFDMYVLYACAGVFMVFLLLAILTAVGKFDFRLLSSEDNINAALDMAVIGTLILLGPFGFISNRHASQVEAIETRLPDFLRDVAEAGRFGMTLPEAIIVASKGRYGTLTEEIQRMASQLEWGVPVSHALRLFEMRINTPLTSRVVSIIIKANEAGGSVADVLTMVARDTREVQLSEEQRRITMTTYLTVIYISFFVFLATIFIMSDTFLPQMIQAGAGLASSGASSGAVGLSTQYIPEVFLAFFVAIVIHAIGDGMMAGVIHSGRIPEGMVHGFVMLLAGWVAMRFFIPPLVVPSS